MSKKYLINDKEVSHQDYLYGEDVIAPPIPLEVSERRIKLLELNLEKLLDHSFHTRDGRRCNAVIKAIDFWRNINKGECDE